MLKPLNNDKVVISVSFRQQIRTISNSKMLEIDLEVVEKFDDFVVFDAISAQFPKVFVISSITLNNERTSYAIHFLKRTLQRFASNTNIFLLSTSSFLSNPCLHFEAFWIQNDGKGSTRIERLFQSAFREKLLSKKNEKFHSISRIVSKLRKLTSYRRNTKIKVFPSQLGKDKSKLSFLRTS